MLLTCQNIDKSFLENHILNHVNFHINDYDKAALVGLNGCGKTTLLRIIINEMPADDGLVTLAKGKTLGYLAQNALPNHHNTIYNEMLSTKQHLIDLEARLHDMEQEMKHASKNTLEILMNQYASATHIFERDGGYQYKSDIVGVLKGLGFSQEEFHREVGTLSGGQKTRVALGKLLLNKPDLVILDEPTNHLDLSSVIWLENYLLNYKGAVLIVSHDRYFLNKIVNKVLELEDGILTEFSGNYSDYAKKKEQLRINRYHAYHQQMQERRHQEEVIKTLRSFNREKSIRRAESRQKALDRMDMPVKPPKETSKMHFSLNPRRESGKDVLSIEDLSKSFGTQTLFSHICFFLKKGEHVAIIGDNGVGKTTLLKMINNLLPKDSGQIKIGTNVFIGYYDQEHLVLHDQKTIFEEISDDYPDLTNTEIRNVLAAFLFTEDDVFKQISLLSGGEKGRVCLAKLMLSNANLLILDEPTNHLDIASKEILEDAINAYAGTVLYVSHDRYFMNRTAHRILELSNGQLNNYLGNYDYYLEKKTPFFSKTEDSIPSKTQNESDNKSDWKLKKEKQAAIRKQQNDLLKLENLIEKLEQKKKEFDEQMASEENCNDAAKLMELQRQKDDISKQLNDCYEKWETLA